LTTASPNEFDRAEVFRRQAGDPRDFARVQAGPPRLRFGEVDPRVANGLGIAILSTPKGVMADHSARERMSAAKILCQVF
jgi:small subunit ribosomal protein S8